MEINWKHLKRAYAGIRNLYLHRIKASRYEIPRN